MSEQNDVVGEIKGRMAALRQRQDDAAEVRRRRAEEHKAKCAAIGRGLETLREMFDATGIGELKGWDLASATTAGLFKASLSMNHEKATGSFELHITGCRGGSLVTFQLVPVEKDGGFRCEIRHDDDRITPAIAFGICADLAEKHFYAPETE